MCNKLNCKQELHSENEIEYINIQTGEKLDLVKVSTLPNNTMLKTNPELWIEWDFEKNNELGLDIWKMTRGCKYKAYWICRGCFENTYQFIKNKTRGHKCSYCSGKLATSENNLAVKNPTLATEWHPTLNRDLTPHKITPMSDQKVWWLGNCGHEWKATVGHRNKNNRGCPYCSGRKVLIGFNNINHTHPHIKQFLVHIEDGDKYSFGSENEILFKCKCGEIFNREIYKVVNGSSSCSRCGDGISFGEKFIYNLLREFNINFKYDSSLTWSERKRYDFIIDDNIIVEVNGEHHLQASNNQYSKNNKQTLADVIKNDRYKYRLAIKNNIEHYFVIDVINKDYQMIKNNILKSGMLELLSISNINWNKILEKTTNSLIYEACELYRENNLTTGEISKILKVRSSTISRYLKIGNELGLCEYIPKSEKDGQIRSKFLMKPVVQFSINGEYINEFPSLTKAANSIGKSRTHLISKACKDWSKEVYGHKWMYLDDYKKSINNN